MKKNYLESMNTVGLEELLPNLVHQFEGVERMDVLSDVLKLLQFRKNVARKAELSGPWGIRRGACKHHNAFFFLIVRGGCYLRIGDSDELRPLQAGDLIMSPKGVECTIMDAPDSPITSIHDLTESTPAEQVCKLGNGGRRTTIVMGYFELESLKCNPLMDALPGVFDLRSEELENERSLEAISRLLCAETPQNSLGSEVMVSRLSYLLFVQVIRAYMKQPAMAEQNKGWLKALMDREIGEALALIHQHPEAPWTVASLAEAVGLSRTAFAVKFANLVQVPPVDYLTSWRMQKAQQLLNDYNLRIEEIANTVGYNSEAAFSKAFKRETGVSPGGFRRERRHPEYPPLPVLAGH